MWPTFFHDLIEVLERGVSVADMFCRILLAIDSDIISLDIHRCRFRRCSETPSIV